MEVPSPWTCPICGHDRDDVAYVTPCLHQLCYGCALWWASKKPSCAVCGQRTRTIRYSVRSEEDYLECAVPQPAARSGSGLQGEQWPAEPAFVAPENSFPPEVWAAFFQQQPNLRPLLRWLDREFRSISRSTWWVVHSRQSIVLLCLCMYGLDEAVLLQELQPSLRNLTESFVRRLITITAAMYGPELRRQLHRQDSRAAAGQQDRPAATPSPAASHQGPPASGSGRSTSPAGPSAEELHGDLRGGAGHPTTSVAPSEEEPGQAEAAGPSTQGRDGSPEGPWRPKKRKASSSPQDSLPPHKKRHQRQRQAGTAPPARTRLGAGRPTSASQSASEK